MAIAGSSDNQNQQLRDIIKSLENLNASVGKTFDIQKSLLESFSQANTSSTKSLSVIKDTMERQQRAVSAYISSLKTSGVVATSGSQVMATAALMSGSKLKSNSAADAETDSVINVIKEHTKQMKESAKNSEASNEKLEKLIGVLEKHTLTNESLKKFIEDVKNGKVFNAESIYGKSAGNLPKDEKDRLSASTNKLLNSIAESNKLASLEYDAREKQDDLDRLQKESDSAIVEIRDALLSGKVEIKGAKTDRERSKYEIAKGAGARAGAGGTNIIIPPKIKDIARGSLNAAKAVAKFTWKAIKFGAGGLIVTINARQIALIISYYNKYRKLDKLIEIANENGIPPSALLAEIQKQGGLSGASLDGSQIKQYISGQSAYVGGPNRSYTAAKAVTSAMEKNALSTIGWVQDKFGIDPGSKWSVRNADGSLMSLDSKGDYWTTVRNQAIAPAFAGTAYGLLPAGANLFGINKLASPFMRLGGKATMNYAMHIAKHSGNLAKARKVFDIGSKMSKWTKFSGGGLQGFASRAALAALFYYSLKTGAEIVENMGEFQQILDDASWSEAMEMRKANHWYTLMPKSMHEDIWKFMTKEAMGLAPEEKESLAYFKYKTVQEFYRTCYEVTSYYDVHFASANTGIGGAFTGSAAKVKDFKTEIQILQLNFKREIAKAEDVDGTIKVLDKYKGLLKNLITKAYEERGDIRQYDEDVRRYDYYSQKEVTVHKKGEAYDAEFREKYDKTISALERRKSALFKDRAGLKKYGELKQKSDMIRAFLTSQGHKMIEKNGLIDPSSISRDFLKGTSIKTAEGDYITLPSELAYSILPSDEDIIKYGKTGYSQYYAPSSDNKTLKDIRERYYKNVINQTNINQDNGVRALVNEPNIRLGYQQMGVF